MKRISIIIVMVLMTIVMYTSSASAAEILTQKEAEKKIQSAICSHKDSVQFIMKNLKNATDLFHEAAFSMKNMDEVSHETRDEVGDYNYWAKVNGYRIYSPQKTDQGYEYKYEMTYHLTKSQDKQVERWINKQARKVSAKKGNKAKINETCRILARHMKYKVTGKHQVYHAIKTGRGQCTHYAILFYRIAKKAGVQTRLVVGDGKGSGGWGGHMWCIAKAGSSWLHVDPCWADNGNKIDKRWIAKGTGAFSSTHRLNPEYRTSQFKRYCKIKK